MKSEWDHLYITRVHASKRMDELTEKYQQGAHDLTSLENLPKAQLTFLKQLLNKIDQQTSLFKRRYDQLDARRNYLFDIEVGLFLYEHLSNIITIRRASNEGFWRYLSLNVFPHLVIERHGIDSVDQFWRRKRRIWLMTVWWYIHLSWQGSNEATRSLLETQGFTTSYIYDIVDRAGKGYRVDVTRELFRQLSLIPVHDRPKIGNVVKVNTAKLILYMPELYRDGIAGYVHDLIKDAEKETSNDRI